MNKRIFATILGIAFCVTYLAGTSAMVDGLKETTGTIASTFDQGPVLVYTDEDFARSDINAQDLPSNETVFVAFSFLNVTLRDNSGNRVDNVYAVSMLDTEDILGLNMTNESTSSQVLIGTQLEGMLISNTVNTGQGVQYSLIYENQTANVNVDGGYAPGSIFPDDWLLVPRSVTNSLRPGMNESYSFLMIVELGEADVDWSIDGAQLKPTSGVVGFFERGIYQVEDDLWTIILITGTITALLVYCIISIETEYNAPTIKILRGVGATRGFVIRVFLVKALFITFVGGVLGTALGFCVASAISSLSSIFGVFTFVTPVATLDSLGLPIAISLISGLIGGVWPAVRASRIFTLRRNGR
ncbi:MAG: hypothetical protein AYK23_00370 [Candidatus Proteinoplasmatales archaeon SG8-5]|nr:MAG: hypothetical protein AYK23_00370 [Candidatus Proteinoplasmatales archaeon SG8-5]